jgi:hypothetical protein
VASLWQSLTPLELARRARAGAAALVEAASPRA